MNDIAQFKMAHKAMKKLHPRFSLFIDDLMVKLEPYWLGSQSKEEVHFIHLIGYGKGKKARIIFTDLLELLDSQAEALFLWSTPDINGLSAFAQVQAFQESHQVFPKLVLTNFFSDFFYDYGVDSVNLCGEVKLVLKFLEERKELDFSFLGTAPIDARGGLLISYLDSFSWLDHETTGMILKQLWERPFDDFETFRVNFVPEVLNLLIQKQLLKKEDLIFFSKDEVPKIKMAFDLIKIVPIIEERGSDLLGFPIRMSFSALQYFQIYIAHKNLSHEELIKQALAFFDPLFPKYTRMIRKLPFLPKQVELDFEGGWRFNANYDQDE